MGKSNTTDSDAALIKRLPSNQFISPITGQVEYKNRDLQAVHKAVGQQIVDYCQQFELNTLE